MASDIEQDASPSSQTLPSVEDFDPVLETAGDRPEVITIPALTDPAADHRDETLARRRTDVDEKHRRVTQYLEESGNDAVVFGRADSVAWFTSGGDLGRELGSEASSVLLYVNRTSRAVITDNVHSARVFEEELAGLGFQLKERSWYEDPGQIVIELGHNKKVVDDLKLPLSPWPKGGCTPLAALRFPLTKLERQRLRELGRALTLAVEATCRNFVQGETEADVAGHLAHRLIREGIAPVELRVVGDDRLSRYRQPHFKSAPIHRRATIMASGRRHGLCASVARTVSFGPVDDEFRARHGLAAMVDASSIFFSRPGESVAEVCRRCRRIYEKFGKPHEWTLDYLGFVVGYSPREMLLLPESTQPLADQSALYWSPSVGPARSGDTIIINARGFEVVTEAQDWPKLEVLVKGFKIERPGILERDPYKSKRSSRDGEGS